MRKSVFSMGLFAALLIAPVAQSAALNALYQFHGGVDGSTPSGGLLRLQDGSFVGTTLGGGTYNGGTVFALIAPNMRGGPWVKQTLHSFSAAEGQQPQGNLSLDYSGRIYGTTLMGGSYGGGAVFRLDPPSASGTWTETTLWSFGNGSDGKAPTPSLIVTDGAVIYGICASGGAKAYGTIFEIRQSSSRSAEETVLWSFTGGSDGKYPSSLVGDQYGAIYGTAAEGGANGLGAVFKFTLSPKVIQPAGLWAFQGTTDGAYPTSLVSDHFGGFYGTLAVGAHQNSNGSVFKLTRSHGKWLVSNVLGLDGGMSGALPSAITVQGNRLLAGVAVAGGSGSCATGHIPVPCGVAYIIVPPVSGGPLTSEKVLWDFAPPPSPSGPSGSLLAVTEQTFFGETLYGGSGGAGTVFALQR